MRTTHGLHFLPLTSLLTLLLLPFHAAPAALTTVPGGYQFSGTNHTILISETNGAIISLAAGAAPIAQSDTAGLWTLTLNSNDVDTTLGSLHANQFSPTSTTHTFSANLIAAEQRLELTYTHAQATLIISASNRLDGIDLHATVTPNTGTVFSLTLPGPLRFDPAHLDRLIVPNHSSDGVGMAYNSQYFVAQPEDTPASWNQSIVGPGGYQTLFGANLIFGDYIESTLSVTADGITWLGTDTAAAWNNTAAIAHRPPATNQTDIILIDTPNGAFFSGSKLGGGANAGYLMRIGGAVDRARVPLALDIVSGAIDHLASQAAPGRTHVALLSMVRGPVVGENWPSEVRLDQWLDRLHGSSVLAAENITVTTLTTVPDMIAAMTNTNLLAILNPYGELIPANLTGGVPEIIGHLNTYVTNGGHWFEVGGHPFFQALTPELYYKNDLFYPPVFADFYQLETTNGHVALYGVQPPAATPWAGTTNPATLFVPGQLRWGADAAGGWFQRSFRTYVPTNQTWTSPRVRLALGHTAPDALAAYASANGFERTLSEKMDAPTLDAFKQSVMVHFKGSANAMLQELDLLPAPALIHFEEYLKGGFDKEYPDHLPPNPSFGTPADFTNFLATAKAAGHLTMPYTNPTFWGVDPKGPTFLATNDAPLLVNLDGTINYEEYFGHGGFTVTPWHPAVQAANRSTRNQFVTNYPIDVLFHDQVGARTWQYDLNPASPTPYAYLDGLVQIAAEDSAALPLSTENGYDRLINHEAQFAGLAWGLAPTTNAPFWRRFLRDRVDPTTWNIFPLAQHLAHDKLAFTYNNLDAAVHNHEVMAWTLGLGYNMTFVITPEDLAADTARREWLRWIDRVQKSVAARYVGQGIAHFTHTWGPQATPDNGHIVARYGPVDVIANLTPTPLTTNTYTLAPHGYLATAPGLIAAHIIEPDGSQPIAYIAETNTSGGLNLYIHATGNTNITLALPTAYTGEVILELEDEPAVTNTLNGNLLTLNLGSAPTADAHLWTATLTPTATRRTYLIDFGRHDGGTNGAVTISPDQNGNHWNNLGPTTQNVPALTQRNNLIDTANTSSSIGIQIPTSGFSANGILNGGLLNPDPALLGNLAITNATMDYFFTTSNATLRLSGLTTNHTYDLTLFGTRDTTTSRSTRYTSGTNSVTLTTSGTAIGSGGANQNNDTTVTLANLQPDPSGQLDLTVSVASGGFAYLGLLQLTEHIPAPPAPTTNRLAIIGSSVAKGWNSSSHTTYPNVFVDGGSWSNGYTGLLTMLLAAQGGPSVTNVAVPGENTAAALARFDADVAALDPDYVLIAYSLANEGLPFTSDPIAASNIVATFTTNLASLVAQSRANGITPVISSVYPHGNYTPDHYALLKHMHLTINSWDVPSLNLLTPADNGSGRWIDGYFYDAGHPNDAGYAEFFYSFVPSLFDALAAGKTNPPSFGPDNRYARLWTTDQTTAPLTFTPSNTIHSYTTAFRFRTSTTGSLAAVRANTTVGSLELRPGQLVYIDHNDNETIIPTNLANGVWHDLALSGHYARSNTLVYINGTLAATLDERIVPDQFILGGPAHTNRAAAPLAVDLQNWCVYRAAWTTDEALAHAGGNLQQSSMEIGAMLKDTSFTNGQPVANSAQSLSAAVLHTDTLAPQTETDRVLIYGSSVAKGWNGGGAYTNGSYALGYAGRITPLLEASGWSVTNGSVAGDNTTKALARFDADATAVDADIIVIALSLGNEGLLWNPPADVLASFTSGLSNLIQRSRASGMLPVVANAYAHANFTPTQYAAVQEMNLLINTWDVPSINLLGAIEDGAGRWVSRYQDDPAHPNSDGHEQMAYAVVPSLFDALRAGQTNTPSLADTHNYVRLNNAGEAPLSFTPSNTLVSFTSAFRARAETTGSVAAVRTSVAPATGGVIEWRDTGVVYRAADDREILAPINATDGRWIDIALSYSEARQLTLLYVDGVLAGALSETLRPTSFVLGGPGGIADRPTAPADLDLQDWCLYRAPWHAVEARAQHHGALQQASMELAAPLADATFTTNQPTENRAQSLSVARVGSDALIPQTGTPPPANLQALSPTNQRVELTWTDTSSTESGFILERRLDQAGAYWTNQIVLPANSTAYTDTNVPGGHYAYRIASIESDRYSDFAPIALVTVTNTPFTDSTIYYREWAARYFNLPQADILIDFNTSAAPDYQGQTWNTITNLTAGTATSLTDTNGLDAGYAVRVSASFATSRTNADAPWPDYAAAAQQSFFAIDSAAQVVWSNLNREADYDIVLFSRRAPTFAGFDYRSRFQLTGSVSSDLMEIDSGSNTVPLQIFSLRPAADRSLSLDILPPLAPTGTVFGGINMITLHEAAARDTFLIDFNTLANPVYPDGQAWTTVNDLTNATPYALVDVLGDASAGYSVTLTDGFDQFRADNGALPDGFSATAESTCFALRDDTPLTATLAFAGLATNQAYSFTLLARRGSVLDVFDYSGTYAFSGATSHVATIDSTSNTTYTVIPPLYPDASGRIELTVSAGPGSGIDFPVLNLIRLRRHHSDSALAASAAPNADPYNTGTPNLIAYALNSDPTQGAVAGAALTLQNVAIDKEQNQLTADYQRHPDSIQALIDVQSTTNLHANWSNDPTVTTSIQAQSSTNQQIQLQRPLNTPNLYLRLKATLQP